MVKRFIDICFSLFIIVFLLSWLTPILGLLILLDSRGPIFYIQPRAGKDGRYFSCLKFRSMTCSDHFVQATENDHRVTRVGRFIRKTSMDELPQFFNVLIGDMSMVGPRPHVKQLNDEYSHLPGYFQRLSVKPGITGLSQILGFRGEFKDYRTMERRLKIDLYYIRNRTVWMDLVIIYRTLSKVVVMTDENAY